MINSISVGGITADRCGSPNATARSLRKISDLEGVEVTTTDHEAAQSWTVPAAAWLRRYNATEGRPHLWELGDENVDALLEIKDLAAAALGEHSCGTDEQAAAAATFRAILAKVESIFTP